MHVDHPAFIKPDNPSSVLWRYINFTKLMSMFDTESLFFCRADKLKETDPFEGTLPLKELESFQKQTRLKPENIRSAYKTHSRETFVNCWHHARIMPDWSHPILIFLKKRMKAVLFQIS